MTSLYDFGKDELGVALNQHVRLTHPFPRIWAIQPYSEIYPRTAGPIQPRSARTNVELIIQAMRIMAARGDIQTVVWDGFTNTARAIKNEVAQKGTNKDESTKNMVTQWGSSKDSVLNMPGMNWRDYGMTQDFMRFDFRNPILAAPEPFHFLGLGHECLNEPEGEYGPDIGGPKGWNFAGGMFEFVLWMGRKGKDRMVATDDYQRGAFTAKATFKRSPDTEVGDNGVVKITDYASSVALWQLAMDGSTTGLVRALLYGGYDVGKTALASAFLGVEGSGNALFVMGDQQLGLATCWPQAKAATEPAKPKPNEAKA